MTSGLHRQEQRRLALRRLQELATSRWQASRSWSLAELRDLSSKTKDLWAPRDQEAERDAGSGGAARLQYDQSRWACSNAPTPSKTSFRPPSRAGEATAA